MANITELEKKKQELAKELEKLEAQLHSERKKEATRVFDAMLQQLTEYAEHLTDEQKDKIGAFVLPPPSAPKKKAGKRARGPRDNTPNARLTGGSKEEFRYSGVGRKPKVLQAFEESNEGKELLAANKPLYVQI